MFSFCVHCLKILNEVFSILLQYLFFFFKYLRRFKEMQSLDSVLQGLAEEVTLCEFGLKKKKRL